MSKPEGTVTVVAKIHMRCSYALQSFSTCVLLVDILRTMFGFLPLIVIILSAFMKGFLWCITNCFLGYAAVIKIGFLVNIGQLPNRSEKVILRLMYLVTGLWVVMGLTLLPIWKWYHGLHLLESARLSNHLYFGGMEVLDHISDSNPSLAFVSVTLAIAVVLHVITFIIKRIKNRDKYKKYAVQTIDKIDDNQPSGEITGESSKVPTTVANTSTWDTMAQGITVYGSYFTMAALLALILIGILAQTNMKEINVMSKVMKS